MRFAALFAAVTATALVTQGVREPAQARQSKLQHVLGTSPAVLHGSDVVATVEGEPITRRQLTGFWVYSDPRTREALGRLLARKIVQGGNASAQYVISEDELSRALYTDNSLIPAQPLSTLVAQLLVAKAAAQEGIVVTATQAQAYAHALFNKRRQERHEDLTDDQIIAAEHIEKEPFLREMLFRARASRLLEGDVARKNGHPLVASDWLVLRQLYAAPPYGGTQDTETRFAQAREQLAQMIKEVNGGQAMADVASRNNSDGTALSGGLRPPVLRGTGTKALEDVVFNLKPGELSEPLRGRQGWYAFRVEQRGDQIPVAAREESWNSLFDQLLPDLLARLRGTGHVTSSIPLPTNPDMSGLTLFSDRAGAPPGPPVLPGGRR